MFEVILFLCEKFMGTLRLYYRNMAYIYTDDNI